MRVASVVDDPGIDDVEVLDADRVLVDCRRRALRDVDVARIAQIRLRRAREVARSELDSVAHREREGPRVRDGEANLVALVHGDQFRVCKRRAGRRRRMPLIAANECDRHVAVASVAIPRLMLLR